eukprot:4686163-Amphidinium_carterae.1
MFHAGVPSPWLTQSKFELVGHYSGPFAISHNDSMSLQPFAGYHNGMQFRLVDGLPAPRQRVSELGRLSRDAAAALPMRRFSWVLPAPI